MSDTAASSQHRFGRKLSVRVPAEVFDALAVAAADEFTSPSHIARRAIVDGLRADGRLWDPRARRGRIHDIELQPSHASRDGADGAAGQVFDVGPAASSSGVRA